MRGSPYSFCQSCPKMRAFLSSKGPGTERARAGPGRLPLREVPRAGGYFRSCQGAGHWKRSACDQFWPSLHHRRVCSPHWAHRPLWEHRQSRLFLWSRVGQALGAAAREGAVGCECSVFELHRVFSPQRGSRRLTRRGIQESGGQSLRLHLCLWLMKCICFKGSAGCSCVAGRDCLQYLRARLQWEQQRECVHIGGHQEGWWGQLRWGCSHSVEYVRYCDIPRTVSIYLSHYCYIWRLL